MDVLRAFMWGRPSLKAHIYQKVAQKYVKWKSMRILFCDWNFSYKKGQRFQIRRYTKRSTVKRTFRAQKNNEPSKSNTTLKRPHPSVDIAPLYHNVLLPNTELIIYKREKNTWGDSQEHEKGKKAMFKGKAKNECLQINDLNTNTLRSLSRSSRAKQQKNKQKSKGSIKDFI